MDLGIRRILELVGHHVAIGVGGDHFFGFLDRPIHPLRRIGEDQPRAQCRHYLASLQRITFRHDQGDGIAPRSGDKSEGDPGVSAGRFDQLLAGLERAALLGVPNHRRPDAVLNGVARIPALDFGKRGCSTALCDAMQFDQGSAANAKRIVRKYHSSATPILALPKLSDSYRGWFLSVRGRQSHGRKSPPSKGLCKLVAYLPSCERRGDSPMIVWAYSCKLWRASSGICRQRNPGGARKHLRCRGFLQRWLQADTIGACYAALYVSAWNLPPVT